MHPLDNVPDAPMIYTLRKLIYEALLTDGSIGSAHTSHPVIELCIDEYIHGLLYISERNFSPFAVIGGQIYIPRMRAFVHSQVFAKFFKRFPSIGNHLESLLKICLDPDLSENRKVASLTEVCSYLSMLDSIFHQFIQDHQTMTESNPVRLEMFLVSTDLSNLVWDLEVSRLKLSELIVGVHNTDLARFYEDAYCASLRPLSKFFRQQTPISHLENLDAATKTGIMYCWEIVGRILGLSTNPRPITNLCRGDFLSLSVMQVPKNLRTEVSVPQLLCGLIFGIVPEVLHRPTYRTKKLLFSKTNASFVPEKIAELRTNVRIPREYQVAETKIFNLLKYFSNVCLSEDPAKEIRELRLEHHRTNNQTPFLESDDVLIDGSGLFEGIDYHVLSKMSAESHTTMLMNLQAILYNLHRSDVEATFSTFSQKKCKGLNIAPLQRDQIPLWDYELEDLHDTHKQYMLLHEPGIVTGICNSAGIVDSPCKFSFPNFGRVHFLNWRKLHFLV
jgi:hypothetical protein